MYFCERDIGDESSENEVGNRKRTFLAIILRFFRWFEIDAGSV